ncbi:MAG TPA: peptidylprolyl isomerase, partial [Alphaproteobacteria bacterium]
MLRLFFVSLAFLAFAVSTPTHAASNESSIAMVVNEDAISASDVNARTKLILVSSGIPDTQELRAKMRPQILSTLVDERLMMQEAGRMNITVPADEIEKGFATIAGQNNMSAEQFKAILKREGIPQSTIADQIESQIAWGRVVQEKLRPKVVVTESELDNLTQRIRGDIGKTQYLISEIFLPVENAGDEANVKQLADKLTGQLTQGKAPFPRVAAQFSQSAGASRGGDMGWIREGELEQAVNDVLVNMKEGELSRPIRSLTGYHIMLLRKKSIMAEEAMPQRTDLYNKLGLDQLERLARRHLLNLK